VTTLIGMPQDRILLTGDMPLNSVPPTTTVENLMVKVSSAQGQCYVDVGFYGGVIPGNDQDLIPLHKAGVKGFKCFMIESGVVTIQSPANSGRGISMCGSRRYH
jgi:dihydroorotase-like cyclic amidohydrolase